jgi:ABC-type uncharacterized transport system substrate-binding protein
MPVIGFLHSAASWQVADLVAAFQTGLKESGFSEGLNLAMEYRWADNDDERLPVLASDLVGRKVDIITAGGGDPSAIAAKHATSKIPIVAVIGGDPIVEGLIASLSHPGGNLTGVSFLTASLTAKRLELLLELAPQAKVIAFLANPNNPQTPAVVDDVQKAAIAMGLQLHIVTAGTEPQLDQAFVTIDRLHVGALVVQGDPYFNNVRGQLIALAARYSLPAIQGRREIVADGGLISYGTSVTDVYPCGQIIGPAVGPSRRLTMIVAQEPAQPLAAAHGPLGLLTRRPREQQDVALPLVIPLGMEMVDVFAQRPPQRALAKEDHLGQALFLDRPHPALGVGIQVRAARRQRERFNPA